MFRVGQKVVCVNIAGGVDREGLRLKEYTVTAVTMERGKTFVGVDGMTVNRDPAPWRADRFRHIVKRKTDISIFTKMLTDAKIPALYTTKESHMASSDLHRCECSICTERGSDIMRLRNEHEALVRSLTDIRRIANGAGNQR
jgi:hypothetical protein